MLPTSPKAKLYISHSWFHVSLLLALCNHSTACSSAVLQWWPLLKFTDVSPRLKERVLLTLPSLQGDCSTGAVLLIRFLLPRFTLWKAQTPKYCCREGHSCWDTVRHRGTTQSPTRMAMRPRQSLCYYSTMYTGIISWGNHFSLTRINMIALMDPDVIVPNFSFPALTICLNFLLQKLNYSIVILLLMSRTFLKHIVLYHWKSAACKLDSRSETQHDLGLHLQRNILQNMSLAHTTHSKPLKLQTNIPKEL